MLPNNLEFMAPPDFPRVGPGDDLAQLILAALQRGGFALADGDVIVVAQKIVSKAENRFVDLATVVPSARAVETARLCAKDPRLVEVILSESRRIVRCARNVLIVEHRLGYVMANGGVDQSNVADASAGALALLLPPDPDGSAQNLRSALQRHANVRIGVVINDSFGRAWRRGTVGVAIGASGLPVLVDKRGERDLFGRTLTATVIGYADEVAAAASLLMGQGTEGRPVVLVRGLQWTSAPGGAADMVRPESEDLFR